MANVSLSPYKSSPIAHIPKSLVHCYTDAICAGYQCILKLKVIEQLWGG